MCVGWGRGVLRLVFFFISGGREVLLVYTAPKQ